MVTAAPTRWTLRGPGPAREPQPEPLSASAPQPGPARDPLHTPDRGPQHLPGGLCAGLWRADRFSAAAFSRTVAMAVAARSPAPPTAAPQSQRLPLGRQLTGPGRGGAAVRSRPRPARPRPGRRAPRVLWLSETRVTCSPRAGKRCGLRGP